MFRSFCPFYYGGFKENGDLHPEEHKNERLKEGLLPQLLAEGGEACIHPPQAL